MISTSPMINTSPLNFAFGSSTPFTAISADTISTDLVIFNESNENITLVPATDHIHTLGNLAQAHFRLSFPTGVIYPLSELAKLSVLRQPDWRVHYTKDDSWEHLYFYWVPLIHTHAEPHLLLKGTHSREQSQDAPNALNSLKLNLFHLFGHPGYASPSCPVELHCGGLVHLGDTSLEGSQRSSSMQLLHVKGLSTLPRQFVSENAPPFVQEDAAPTAQVTEIITQTETGWFRDIVTQPAPASILASVNSPLTLDLQSDNNSGALYIADEPISMDVVIRNGDTNDVTLSPSSVDDMNVQPSSLLSLESLPSLDWIRKVYSGELTLEVLQKFQRAITLVQRVYAQGYGTIVDEDGISVRYSNAPVEGYNWKISFVDIQSIPGVTSTLISYLVGGLDVYNTCQYQISDVPSQLTSLTSNINSLLATSQLSGAQFALYFFAGVLQDPANLSQIKVVKSTLGNASDWHIKYVQQNAKLNGSDAPCDCFYFYWIPTSGETTLTLRGTTSHTNAPNSLSLTLNYLNAAASYQNNGTSVQLTYGGKCSNAQHPISGDKQGLLGYYYSRTINLINHTGNAICPLAMSFVDSNTILNDGVTVNSLTLRLTNYSNQDDIPLTSQSEFRLIFVSSITDGEDSNSALATDNEIENVVVTSKSNDWACEKKNNNKEWVIKPQQNLQITGFKHQTGWDFKIAGLTTTTDNGHSPVTLYYDHLPGYWDGHLVTTIEKSPIAYRSPAKPDSPGSDKATQAVAVTISPRFSGDAENVSLEVKQGNLQVDENITLGANLKDSRFTINPHRPSAKGALFLAPDNSDGGWDWSKSFVYRHQDGYIGLGANDPNSITEGLHLFGNRNLRLDGGHIYLANSGYGMYWGSNRFMGSSNDGTQLGFWDKTNGWNLYVDASGVTHAGHGINIDSGNLRLDGGSIRLRGGELSSYGPVTLHADDDGNGDANSLVVTKGAISGSITTVFTVDNSGDLSTHGGWISSIGGTITTDGGVLATRGGNFFTGYETSEGGGGSIYSRGGNIYLGGGGIDTQGGGITVGNIYSRGGNIYLGGGGIDTQGGGITVGTINVTNAINLNNQKMISMGAGLYIQAGYWTHWDDICIGFGPLDSNNPAVIDYYNSLMVSKVGNIDCRDCHTYSSEKIKENILQFASGEAHRLLDALSPVKFNYKDDSNKREKLGFIAESCPPEIVHRSRLVQSETQSVEEAEPAEEYLSLSNMSLITILTAVVKDLKQEVETLKARLAS